MKAWLAALAGLAGLNLLAAGVFQSPFPPPAAMRLSHDDAVQGAGLLSLGMRRLAADLAFTRLLMYYGSPEEHAEAPSGEPARGHRDPDEHGHDHGHAHPPSEPADAHGPEYGRGEYPEMAPRAMRILDLDPFFAYAAQYAAAALAFNLDQPDRALDVLRHALSRDPKNWKYHAYVGAIAFHKKGDPAQVLEQLRGVEKEPDCPTMLKHMLAFLYRRQGRRDDAIRLYRDILESRDKDYHHWAREGLRQLGAAE